MKWRLYKKSVVWAFALALAVGQVSTAMAADAAPKTLWENTFGGATADSGAYVTETKDGGYVATGYMSSASGQSLAIVKVDSKGAKLWEKTYAKGVSASGRVVIETADGGLLAVGSQYDSYGEPGKLYLVKTDKDGNKLWDNAYGAKLGGVWGNGVVETKNGDILAVGGTNAGRVLLVKATSKGVSVWEKEIGASGSWADRIYATEGGYVISGNTNPSGSDQNIYLVKIDGEGKILWERSIGGKGKEWSNDVAQTADGGYVVVGNTNSKGIGDNDLYLVRTDAAGKVLWDKTCGGAKNDWGRGVTATWDGGIAAVGILGSDANEYGWGDHGSIYVWKTDANGVLKWETTLASSGRDAGQDIEQTKDGGFVLAGDRGTGAGDLYVGKLAGDGSVPAKAPSQEPVTQSGGNTAPDNGKPAAAAKKIKQVSADVQKISLAKGKTKAVKLTAVYTDGTKADVAGKAAWTTSNAKVATVSKTGVVTAKGKGTAVIKAVIEGKTVSINVTVK